LYDRLIKTLVTYQNPWK